MADNYTYYGSAAITASGFTSVFNFACPYVVIQNTGTNAIFVTTDGKTVPVTAGGDGIFEIPSGATVTIPNEGLGTWRPSQSVISAGTIVGGTPGTPAEVYPYGSSLAGGGADPGVKLNFIAVTATTTFVATAAG